MICQNGHLSYCLTCFYLFIYLPCITLSICLWFFSSICFRPFVSPIHLSLTPSIRKSFHLPIYQLIRPWSNQFVSPCHTMRPFASPLILSLPFFCLSIHKSVTNLSIYYWTKCCIWKFDEKDNKKKNVWEYFVFVHTRSHFKVGKVARECTFTAAMPSLFGIYFCFCLAKFSSPNLDFAVHPFTLPRSLTRDSFSIAFSASTSLSLPEGTRKGVLIRWTCLEWGELKMACWHETNTKATWPGKVWGRRGRENLIPPIPQRHWNFGMVSQFCLQHVTVRYPSVTVLLV